jgi:hypothetical protein
MLAARSARPVECVSRMPLILKINVVCDEHVRLVAMYLSLVERAGNKSKAVCMSREALFENGAVGTIIKVIRTQGNYFFICFTVYLDMKVRD